MNTSDLAQKVIDNLSPKEFEGIVKDLGFKLDNLAGVKLPYANRASHAINALKARRAPVEDAIEKAIKAKA